MLLSYDSALPTDAAHWQLGAVHFMLAHQLPNHPSLLPSVVKATWALEEELRQRFAPGPSVVASAFSPGFTIPPFAAAAARLGQDRDTAQTLFRQVCENYTVPPFALASEYSHTQGPRYNYGNYVTQQGALLQAVLLGFAGLRVTPDPPWAAANVSLPAGWEGLRVGKLFLGGAAHSLSARHGEPAVLTPLGESQLAGAWIV